MYNIEEEIFNSMIVGAKYQWGRFPVKAVGGFAGV